MKTDDVRSLLFRTLIVVAAVLSAPVLLLAGFVAFRIGGEYLARTEFEALAWQESARPAQLFMRDATRLRMIDDLLDRYDLVGMTRSRVTALLGEPEDGSGDDRYQFPGWDLAYYLGPERGLLGLDSEWLAIRLDEDNRVSEYRIIIP
jgi:hypothetical protein